MTDSAEQEPVVNTDGSGGEPGATAEQQTDQMAAVVQERDQLATEKADLWDRLMRRQAEFDNFRRRIERERAEQFEFAGSETVRALLPILDDFERALKTESGDKEYARGVELIYQRLMDTLKKLGLEPIDAVGKKFDPHVHEAIDRFPTEEVDEDTVVEEFQRGYNFKGRLVRPSMVKVAVRP